MIYSSRIKICFDQGATADLKAIEAEDPEGHDDLVVLLEELEDDPRLRDKLLTRYYADEDVSVKRWVDAYKHFGVDLMRLKFWDLEDYHAGFQYRVIYYFHPPDQAIYVMAVVNKLVPGQFNYDDRNHPIRQRILARLNAEFNGGYGRRH